MGFRLERDSEMKREEIAQSQKLEMSHVGQYHLQRQEVSYQRVQKRLNPEFIKCFECKVGLKDFMSCPFV